MDNFNLQGYIASGKIHTENTLLTEAKKQDSKKGNSSEQKRMEGAIKDDRDHIKNLKKDIEDNERKLARLKKDYKKDVINEDGDFDSSSSESILDIEEIMQGLAYGLNDIEDVIINKAIEDTIGDDSDEDEEIRDFIQGEIALEYEKSSKSIENAFNEILKKTIEKFGSDMHDDPGDIRIDHDYYTEAESKPTTKMKVSELKAKIKEDILAELSLNEKEEVDVDIDVEDEVDVDVEADDIEIEKKGTDIKVEVGLSPEEELIQDSLKAAMDAADSLGNQKLADQIGNTITFFTREYVVGDRS